VVSWRVAWVLRSATDGITCGRSDCSALALTPGSSARMWIAAPEA
jgi:hypothetical protein